MNNLSFEIKNKNTRIDLLHHKLQKRQKHTRYGGRYEGMSKCAVFAVRFLVNPSKCHCPLKTRADGPTWFGRLETGLD